MKKLVAIVLLLVFAMLTSCAPSMSSRYENAQNLLAKGLYEQAAKAFSELGAYEDASKYLMYIKALQIAEDGDYPSALSSLMALGDFADASLQYEYYTARQAEANQDYAFAKATYDSIATFRDAKERGDALWQKRYNQAYELAENGRYDEGISLFSELGDYQDCSQQITYYTARQAEESEAYEYAKYCYDSLASFRDAKDRSEALWSSLYTKALSLQESGEYDESIYLFSVLVGYKDSDQQVIYSSALQAEMNGDHEWAKEQYDSLGTFRDSTARGNAIWKGLYDQGCLLMDAQQYDDARALFAMIGDFSDSQERILESYYRQAQDLLALGNYEGASAAFAQAGDYSDASERVLEPFYVQAETLLASDDYIGASEAFSRAGEYNDAKERILEPYYMQAEALLASGDYDGASTAFLKAGEYNNAGERILEPYYIQAEALLTAGNFDGASSAFAKAGEYKDAKARILEPFYIQAEALLASGDYEGASEAFIKADNYGNASDRIYEPYYTQAEAFLAAGDFNGAIVAFTKAGDYKDAKDRVCETYYMQAEVYRKAKEFDKAYAIYINIKGYKDVDNLLNTDENLVSTPAAAIDHMFAVGNSVVFGSYEQDNILNNGDEGIEWIVLERDGMKAMIVSKYTLDSVPYNSQNIDVSWESCSLHSWLNGDFYDVAFSTADRAAIVPNEDNIADFIFLLSVTEVVNHFPMFEDRECKATEYAVANNAAMAENGKCWWWLRDMKSSSNAICVDFSGRIGEYVPNMSRRDFTVRPALWLDLESEFINVIIDQSHIDDVTISDKNEEPVNAESTDSIENSTYDFVDSVPTDVSIQRLFANDNTNVVASGPQYQKTSFTLSDTRTVTSINTYNFGYGMIVPGSTTLYTANGSVIGTWDAVPEYGATKDYVYWCIKPNIVLPAGTYYVSISKPETWSYNTKSNGYGFLIVYGY